MEYKIDDVVSLKHPNIYVKLHKYLDSGWWLVVTNNNQTMQIAENNIKALLINMQVCQECKIFTYEEDLRGYNTQRLCHKCYDICMNEEQEAHSEAETMEELYDWGKINEYTTYFK